MSFIRGSWSGFWLSALLVTAGGVFCPSVEAATRTWDGGGTGGTNMDTAVNWSGDTVPSGSVGDTAQWDGTVSGPLSLTYTAAGTGANLAASPGILMNVAAGQTS